jgi:cytochrome c biogenesis protein CcdA
VLPTIRARYGSQLEIQIHDLNEPDGYQVFAALHESNPDLPIGVPQLFIDGKLLVGTLRIRDNLPLLVDECLANDGCDWPFTIIQPTAAPSLEPGLDAKPVYLAFCYDPTCLECDRVKYDLNYLQIRYPNLVVQKFNVWYNAAAIEAMCARYAVPVEDRLKVPAVFVGDSYLGVEDISLSRLTTLVDSASLSGSIPPWETVSEAAVESAEASIVERFGSFSLLAVTAAGLLDGVNPCAFTTIIFFISYLALVGRSKRDVLVVGTAFTLAVFLTYLLLGLGLSALLEQIGSISSIARVIYGGTALVCLGLAVLSLWDYIQIRRGRLGDIALQLPSFLKKRIHETIRTHSRMRGYVAAAFGAGILVSVFELACTGQVYLPTIVFMTSVAEMRLSALAYLALYNAAFVVPLVIVFTITYFGINSQQLTATFKANAGAVKLFTTALFAVLGGWLGYLLFR